jgi:hypothetical protein
MVTFMPTESPLTSRQSAGISSSQRIVVPLVANAEEIAASRISMKDVMVPSGSSGFDWGSEVYWKPGVPSNYEVYL